MISRTLLLPCAGKSSRYPGVRPKWMLTMPDGRLALQRAAASVPQEDFDRIVVAVRADHEEKFGCRALLHRAFGDNAEELVVQMVEKSLVSNFVSIGLYGVLDAAFYLKTYTAVAEASDGGEIFLSHVLSRMARGGEPVHLFRTLPDIRDAATADFVLKRLDKVLAS